jgi:ATP synthase protein I
VGARENRKLRARARRDDGAWAGLGLFSIVGWSIVVPTLVAVALGAWLDGWRPSDFSWTLALLLAGVFLGCLNAWHWVSKERQLIDEAEPEPKEPTT